MPALCDVNYLLALCYQNHEHHPQALSWFDQQDDMSVILCRYVQLGLLRLLCNPSVMRSDVHTLKGAWEVYDLASSDARFEFVIEPDGLEPFLRNFTASGSVAPKLWQDAYLAAFACAANYRIVTFDQDFRQFQGLQLIYIE